VLIPPHTVPPRVITVDKNAAYPKAFQEPKGEGILPQDGELRRVKYLNNIVEQDHRAHQTARQTWHGFLFLRDSLADAPRL
jgi:transposase, IS6 family